MSKCKGMRARYLNDVLKLHQEVYLLKISKLFGINKGTIMNWVNLNQEHTIRLKMVLKNDTLD